MASNDVDFVMTVLSDDDINVDESEESMSDNNIEEEECIEKKTKKKKKKTSTAAAAADANKSMADNMNADFQFGFDDALMDTWDMATARAKASNNGRGGEGILDDIISKHLIEKKKEKKKRKTTDMQKNKSMDNESEGDSNDSECDSECDMAIDNDVKEESIHGYNGVIVDNKKKDDGEGEDSDSDSDNSCDSTAAADDDDGDEEMEKQRKKDAFFSSAPAQVSTESFSDMNLSRPLLRAVASLGFIHPTPIQANSIPLALLGKDICACAATGSGKTAAFMLPVLERLLYRPRKQPVTRVLVLSPTRELGVQVHAMAEKLATFLDVHICLAVGGLPVRQQEAALRLNPDIVVATPGRLIDHLRNSPAFDLNGIEILIMDEADRLLEMGFKDEVEEIINACAPQRQTMLFSATMTDEVEQLVSLSLRSPVRLWLNENNKVVSNLMQEFVRIRQQREQDREAIVVALCKRTFKERCIVFVNSKKLAHRLRILFGLHGLVAAELHGDLTQAQRLESLDRFRNGTAKFLLATDLASRGLDIVGVDTVLNYAMPHTLSSYIHRVGRTARAGRHGKAVTLVGEQERKMLKEVVRHGTAAMKSRIVPAAVIEHYKTKNIDMMKDIASIMQQEKEEKALREADMHIDKAQNMIRHADEIYSRPARTWFQTEGERKLAKEQAKLGHLGDMDKKMQQQSEKKKINGPKVPVSEDERNAINVMKFHRREEKRKKKGNRIKSFPEDSGAAGKSKRARSTAGGGGTHGVGFDQELTNTSAKALRAMRAPANQANAEMVASKKRKANAGGDANGRAGKVRSKAKGADSMACKFKVKKKPFSSMGKYKRRK